VFPILVNVVAGMRNVNPLLLKAARSMGARSERHHPQRNIPPYGGQLLHRPSLGDDHDIARRRSRGTYVSTAGVGYFTKLFAETFDPAPLLCLDRTLAIMAIGLNEIVRTIERRFTRWKD